MPADADEIALHGKNAGDAVVVLRTHWGRSRSNVVAELDQSHTRSPDELGPGAARLRRIAAPLVLDAMWRALVDSPVAEGAIARSGPWLHLPGHSVELDAREQGLAASVLALLLEGRFDPPWVRDLAKTTGQHKDAVRRVLRKLAREGDVYQVVRDLFYHRAAERELLSILAN